MALSVKLNKLKNSEISDNIQLKEYLDTLRSVFYELYIDISFMAEVLHQDLANMKGVKNRLRARIIAGSLRGVAELCKSAGGGAAGTWRQFEQRFAQELEAAPSSKAKRPEKFKIV